MSRAVGTPTTGRKPDQSADQAGGPAHVRERGARESTADWFLPTHDRILIVERDARLANQTAEYLEDHVYRVDIAASGAAAHARWRTSNFDIVLMDHATAGPDLLKLCRAFSHAGGPAIVILSDNASEEERVLGYECGADDFMPRSIAQRELLARIKAVLRRRNATIGLQPAARLSLHGCTFDPVRRVVRSARGSALLSSGEAGLLEALARHSPHAVDRNVLIGEMGLSPDSGRAVDLLVCRLRRKLASCGATDAIRTHRGAGYFLSGPVSALP